MGAVVLVIVSQAVGSNATGDTEAELLRAVDRHSSDVTISAILSGVGIALLLFPLLYLFRAALDRSPRMRRQFVGVIIAAPLFLAGSGIVNGIVRQDAASDFVAGKAKADEGAAKDAVQTCRDKRKDDAKSFHSDFPGAKPFKSCIASEIDDNRAQNAIHDASLSGLAVGLGVGGALGFAAALLYTCRYAMRAGLLTRFWGSLGMALGVMSLFPPFFIFTMAYFIYVGLLIAGWVPGGRPPAWAAGEAIPWPTPGEAAPPGESDEAVAGSGRQLSDEPEDATGEAADAASPRQRGERRKRKQRRS
jgi:hypothetical protein